MFLRADKNIFQQFQQQKKSEIRIAKEKWLTAQCDEIEQLKAKYDSFNMHKKIKQTPGNYKTRCSNILMNKKSNNLNNAIEKLREWRR